MDWSYFDKFNDICDKYLPIKGEGDTVATQIVTAVCKLVQYEYILAELADSLLDEDSLEKYDQYKKTGSIYDCTGPFKFVEGEDEEDYWQEDEDYEDEEEIFDEED